MADHDDCGIAKLVERIETDIAELKKDVKALLAFKWQVVGGSVLFSTIFSTLVAVTVAILTSVLGKAP